jgi:hypothetical protein
MLDMKIFIVNQVVSEISFYTHMFDNRPPYPLDISPRDNEIGSASVNDHKNIDPQRPEIRHDAPRMYAHPPADISFAGLELKPNGVLVNKITACFFIVIIVHT